MSPAALPHVPPPVPVLLFAPTLAAEDEALAPAPPEPTAPPAPPALEELATVEPPAPPAPAVLATALLALDELAAAPPAPPTPAALLATEEVAAAPPTPALLALDELPVAPPTPVLLVVDPPNSRAGSHAVERIVSGTIQNERRRRAMNLPRREDRLHRQNRRRALLSLAFTPACRSAPPA